MGIYISNDVNEINYKNFYDKIEKIKEILGMWTLRKMTIRGKIQIINTMMITQMLYPGNVLYIPKMCIKEYNNIISQFIWDNKPPKIKYSTLINTIENGGLKLQDLTSKLDALKIKWFKQMENVEYKSAWKSYLSYKFKDECCNIPHYDFDNASHPIFSDNFHIELFTTWNKIHSVKVVTYEDIYRQNIMNNRNMLVGHNVIKNDFKREPKTTKNASQNLSSEKGFRNDRK